MRLSGRVSGVALHTTNISLSLAFCTWGASSRPQFGPQFRYFPDQGLGQFVVRVLVTPGREGCLGTALTDDDPPSIHDE